MNKKKYYVVWQGRKPGVYDTWKECQAQILEFPGAKYKGFESAMEAQKHFLGGYENYYKQNPPVKKKQIPYLTDHDEKPDLDSICVDAACNMVTRVMEYRGVDTRTGEQIFHQGPFKNATNNIGEFLALVHGLALLKQQGSNKAIYTDSITAISWVRHKKHKSIISPIEENALLFDLLARAEKWLNENQYANPIIKWNTRLWGEIPADFGRK
ncbi:MAG TPA: ribonuclease H family protein [Bacteroidales bacterium]|nr:ribonuclease H family protein [Bacteroidales bacterium]MDD4394554.1 ribonuclease H family protein [Bacteroidales bacterium]HNW67284.1 ribonuclease H family protein [Bacteroidales bacterium]HPT51655.1 ribonuclease H family protein [Bacteroidales bacterium]